MKLNVVFMGTPIFGRIVLEKLYNRHNVIAVVCPPDKPNKRGNKIVPCEVKQFAVSKGLTILQPDKVNNEVEKIKSFNADLIVTASFGQIISKDFLTMCPYGTLNVHGSLLPALRGASPVPQSILNGDSATGVTIMRMTERMDEGDMLLCRSLEIGDTETASELMERMASLGGDLLVDAIDQLIHGEAVFTKQDHSKATYCAKINKEDAKINFDKPATVVKCQINGYSSEPGAYFSYEGKEYKILRAKVNALSGKPGEILKSSPKQGLVIACSQGSVEALELQAPGGKRLKAKDFLNGKKFDKGIIIQ